MLRAMLFYRDLCAKLPTCEPGKRRQNANLELTAKVSQFLPQINLLNKFNYYSFYFSFHKTITGFWGFGVLGFWE